MFAWTRSHTWTARTDASLAEACQLLIRPSSPGIRSAHRKSVPCRLMVGASNLGIMSPGKLVAMLAVATKVSCSSTSVYTSMGSMVG